MKYFISFLFLTISLLLLSSCGGNKNAAGNEPVKVKGVDFIKSEDLRTVLEKANDDNKLVFVDIYTTWCAPCKVMDEYVFTDPELERFMERNFINYKVDAEKGNGQTVATVYNAQVFPTLLFLDGDGNQILRRDGGATISEMRAMAEEALAKRAR